jgi:hypothetical protein
MKASTKKYVEDEAKRLDLDGIKKTHDACLERARTCVYWDKKTALVEIQAAIIFDKEYAKRTKGKK